METGLSVNKHIFQILSKDEALAKMVGKNIYPLVAEEDVKLPFITFTKSSVVPSYYKVGVADDKVSFTVNIVANDYVTTVNIAERIRQLLEGRISSYFKRIELSNCYENYSNDNYVQNLQFLAII